MDQPATHDVAISFLFADLPYADDLNARLEQTLNVFFFPRAQEELAGTNGLESMRMPFLEARVVVVLFRQRWGNTDWTRVEMTAIEERFLRKGWKSLMFVTLDDSDVPAWVPPTHVRFSAKDYPIEELVGAIKSRVQDNGGVVSQPDHMMIAKRMRADEDLRSDERRMFSDPVYVRGPARAQVNALFQAIAERAEAIAKEATFQLETVVHDARLVIRYGAVSIDVEWVQQYGDMNGAEIRFRSLAGAFYLRGEKLTNRRQPQQLKAGVFKPKLDGSRLLRWVGANKHQLLSDDDVLRSVIDALLRLVDRANRGDIPRDRRNNSGWTRIN